MGHIEEASPESQLHIFDMHCHLDFCLNPAEIAAGLAESGVGCFSQTMKPQDFERVQSLFVPFNNVRVGLGMHPWEVPTDEGALHEYFDQFVALVHETSWVGEVGLDFSPRHEESRSSQLWMFEEIAKACARKGERVISIHAVQSAGIVLDVWNVWRFALATRAYFTGFPEPIRNYVAQ